MSLDVADVTISGRVGDRSERLIMAAAGLGAVVCAAIAFWPVRDYREEYRRLGATETRAVAAWQAILSEVRAERLSDAQVADRIEREVLPVWRDAGRQAADLPAGATADPERLFRAFQTREDAWKAMIAAARSRDPALSRQAARKWAEADEALARLRGTTTRNAE